MKRFFSREGDNKGDVEILKEFNKKNGEVYSIKHQLASLTVELNDIDLKMGVYRTRMEELQEMRINAGREFNLGEEKETKTLEDYQCEVRIQSQKALEQAQKKALKECDAVASSINTIENLIKAKQLEIHNLEEDAKPKPTMYDAIQAQDELKELNAHYEYCKRGEMDSLITPGFLSNLALAKDHFNKLKETVGDPDALDADAKRRLIKANASAPAAEIPASNPGAILEKKRELEALKDQRREAYAQLSQQADKFVADHAGLKTAKTELENAKKRYDQHIAQLDALIENCKKNMSELEERRENYPRQNREQITQIKQELQKATKEKEALYGKLSPQARELIIHAENRAHAREADEVEEAKNKAKAEVLEVEKAWIAEAGAKAKAEKIKPWEEAEQFEAALNSLGTGKSLTEVSNKLQGDETLVQQVRDDVLQFVQTKKNTGLRNLDQLIRDENGIEHLERNISTQGRHMSFDLMNLFAKSKGYGFTLYTTSDDGGFVPLISEKGKPMLYVGLERKKTGDHYSLLGIGGVSDQPIKLTVQTNATGDCGYQIFILAQLLLKCHEQGICREFMENLDSKSSEKAIDDAMGKHFNEMRAALARQKAMEVRAGDEEMLRLQQEQKNNEEIQNLEMIFRAEWSSPDDKRNAESRIQELRAKNEKVVGTVAAAARSASPASFSNAKAFMAEAESEAAEKAKAAEAEERARAVEAERAIAVERAKAAEAEKAAEAAKAKAENGLRNFSADDASFNSLKDLLTSNNGSFSSKGHSNQAVISPASRTIPEKELPTGTAAERAAKNAEMTAKRAKMKTLREEREAKNNAKKDRNPSIAESAKALAAGNHGTFGTPDASAGNEVAQNEAVQHRVLGIQ